MFADTLEQKRDRRPFWTRSTRARWSRRRSTGRSSAATVGAARRWRVRPYDFKRPERVSKDQMRALQTLHESFARNFGASLSGFLRTIVGGQGL
ncbi:MAG: hypothetical protein HC765_03760, partial [Brachymonas sp.]|nr:hypothetical protein [Brachymonas sp.]